MYNQIDERYFTSKLLAKSRKILGGTIGDSFQVYLDLLLIWLLLIDVCVLVANVINRYTKEPSRCGERSFMKYSVAALVALFVAVVLYSALHPEVRRPIIGIEQFFFVTR